MKSSDDSSRRHFLATGLVGTSAGLLAGSLSAEETTVKPARKTTAVEKVRYAELLPHEFRTRLAARQIAYLPLGTLEWHGEHLPLGSDAIQSEGLMVECALRFGGIVMPPIYLGPDRAKPAEDGTMLIGMDYANTTTPPRKLEGSCYWTAQGFHLQMVDTILEQLKRTGFRAVFADGHGPSRWSWVENISEREARYGMRLFGVSKDINLQWKSQIDHAALNETSLMLHYRPDLVDLARLSESRSEIPQGIGGEDPRDATAAHGKECLQASVELVGQMFSKAGLI